MTRLRSLWRLWRLRKVYWDVAMVEPWKLREIAEWFDTIDELLDRLVVSGQDFRQRYSFPKKDEIQRDLRHWADALDEVEAIVARRAE